MSFTTTNDLVNARQRIGITELERSGMNRKEIASALGVSANMLAQVMGSHHARLGPKAHLSLVALCLARDCFGIVLCELPANWALYHVDPTTVDGCLNWERRAVLEGMGIGSDYLERGAAEAALPHLIRAHSATGSAVLEARAQLAAPYDAAAPRSLKPAA